MDVGAQSAPVLFDLRWTPTIKDFERAVLAKRRATGALLTDRVLGVLLALFCSTRLSSDVASSLPGVLVGLAYATGLWGRAYRYLFSWRHATGLFRPTHAEVMADAARETDDQKSVTTRWEVWEALIPLDDMLVLLTSAKGNGGIGLLPRRGLQDTSQWPDLVALVTEHVPLHPKLKKR